MKQALKSILGASGWLGLFLVSSVVVAAIFGFLGFVMENEYAVDSIISCVFCFEVVSGTMSFQSLVNGGWLVKAANFTMLLLFLSYLPVFCVAGVETWRNRESIASPKMGIMLFVIAAAAVFNLVLEVLAAGIGPLLPQEDSVMLQFVMMLATGGSPYAVVVISGILAPIVEEVVLRGGVQKSLQKINPAFAIIATAVIFGVLHGNLIQGVFAGAFGLLLGYVYYKTDNLFYTIGMHITVNMTGCIISLAQIPELVSYVVVAIVLCVIYVAWSFYKNKKLAIPDVFSKGETVLQAEETIDDEEISNTYPDIVSPKASENTA